MQYNPEHLKISGNQGWPRVVARKSFWPNYRDAVNVCIQKPNIGNWQSLYRMGHRNRMYTNNNWVKCLKSRSNPKLNRNNLKINTEFNIFGWLTAVGCTAHYMILVFQLVLYPPLHLRQCIALFAAAQGWLLHAIGWFVLFWYQFRHLCFTKTSCYYHNNKYTVNLVIFMMEWTRSPFCQSFY